jgi:hypothetical protein
MVVFNRHFQSTLTPFFCFRHIPDDFVVFLFRQDFFSRITVNQDSAVISCLKEFIQNLMKFFRIMLGKKNRILEFTETFQACHKQNIMTSFHSGLLCLVLRLFSFSVVPPKDHYRNSDDRLKFHCRILIFSLTKVLKCSLKL